MKNKNRPKLKDIAFLVASPIAATILTWTLPLTFLQSILLFFGVPALYLSLRNKTVIKRCLIFSLALTSAGTFACYLAEKNLAWWTHSDFSWRVGGMVTIEGLVWFFLLSYLILVYYEFFFDHAAHKLLSRRMTYLFTAIGITGVVFGLSWLVQGRIFSVDYYYLKLGIFFGLLPLLAFIIEFPRFISIFLKMLPYFFSLHFLNEIVSLHRGYWTFPGKHFIGWVNLGTFSFPYEELIFWMILFSSIVIVYFELFDDNRLKFKLRF